MTPSWHLVGLGHVPWEQVRQACAGATCAWADYTGFHVMPGERLPTEVPPYSHLWAWSPRRLLRVRIDGDQGVVGILTEDPSPWPDAPVREPVEVIERQVRNFQDDRTTTLFQVVGPMPVSFVAGA